MSAWESVQDYVHNSHRHVGEDQHGHQPGDSASSVCTTDILTEWDMAAEVVFTSMHGASLSRLS